MARSRPHRIMVDLDDDLLEVVKKTGQELAKREGSSKYLRVNGDVMLGTTIRRILELSATPPRIILGADVPQALRIPNDALRVLPEGMQVGTLTPEEAPDGEERWGFGGQGS